MSVVMPYRDPEQQRAYMRAWRVANAQKVEGYQRAAVLASALSKCRFPAQRSVERYGLSEEELTSVVASVLGVRCGGSAVS